MGSFYCVALAVTMFFAMPMEGLLLCLIMAPK